MSRRGAAGVAARGEGALTDPDRLAALRRSGLLDSAPEEAFDRFTRLVARILGVPMALVWLVDDDRHFLKSCVGLPEPLASRREMPLSHSFCQVAVRHNAPLVVRDARSHPLLAENKAIADLGVIAYAGVPLRLKDGHVLGTLCAMDVRPRQWTDSDIETLRDLAEGVRTELELRDANAEVVRLRSTRMRVEQGLHIAYRAIAAAASGITIADARRPDMPIIYVNPAFTAITGYPAKEVLGRNCRFLQGPTTDLPGVARMREAIAARTHCRVELQNYRKDGSIFWNELTLSPVTDAQGEVTHYIGLQVDSTARKRIERELEGARLTSEAANQAKSRFLANMSHELRTPLNTVILYSELLQEEAEGRGVDDFVPDLEKIRRAGRHLLALVNGVLDLARVEAGRMEVYLERVDVAATVQDVVALAAPLLARSRDSLDVQLAADVGSIRTDATKFRQILSNLLSNAARFTTDGRVYLQVWREQTDLDEMMVCSVRDTGIGMTADQLTRLFQPFSQADDSVTRKYGGTGLGLAICAQFADLLGGSVQVSSEPARGTEFVVRLPVDPVLSPDTRSANVRDHSEE